MSQFARTLKASLPALAMSGMVLSWLAYDMLTPTKDEGSYAVMVEPGHTLEENILRMAESGAVIERTTLLPSVLIVRGMKARLANAPQVWLILNPLLEGGCMASRSPQTTTL